MRIDGKHGLCGRLRAVITGRTHDCSSWHNGQYCPWLRSVMVRTVMPSVLWRCWLGGRKGSRPVKNWVVGCWHGYLSGAWCRLAHAQLMPLPLTISCFSKIQIGFTFLVPHHPGSPGQRAVKRVCVCVCGPYSSRPRAVGLPKCTAVLMPTPTAHHNEPHSRLRYVFTDRTRVYCPQLCLRLVITALTCIYGPWSRPVPVQPVFTGCKHVYGPHFC